MCTLIAMFGVHPEFPLILASNRDEFYERPSVSPSVLETEPVRIAGGLDVQRGGTWLGVNHLGAFAGVTNQRTWQPFDPTRRSRGEVPVALLRQPSIDAMVDELEALPTAEYNPFNLMFGTASGLYVAYVRDDGLELESLEPGIHVLANDRLESPHFPKQARAEELVRAVMSEPWSDLENSLATICGDHYLPPQSRFPGPPRGTATTKSFLQQLQAICIHTPLYGTRSSTLLALDEGRVAHYLYANGQPCQAPYEDMLRGLDDFR